MDRSPSIRNLLLALLLLTAACQKPEQNGEAEHANAPPGTVNAAAPEDASSDGSTVPGPLLPLAPSTPKTADAEPPATAIAPVATPVPEPPVPKPPVTSTATPVASDPVVEVVRPGATPRRKLRLRAATGQKERLKMTMVMDLTAKVGLRTAPKTQLPPMVMFMTLDVSATQPNGDILYQFALDKTDVQPRAGVHPKVATALRTAMSSMNGTSGRALVSARGFRRQVSLAMPPGADQQTQQIVAVIEQAMQQLVPPLPEEPVGVGAQWTLTQTVEQNGIAVQQVATYDLTGIQGNTISTDVTVSETAAPQSVTVPGAGTMKLLSLDSKGTGNMRTDLTKLTPQISKRDLNSTVHMEIPQQPRMLMTTHILIEITPS